MTHFTSVALALGTTISWAFAALAIWLQLEDGVDWKEINLVLPFCLGGIGLGLMLSPFFGWFQHTESTSADVDDSEGDSGGDAGDIDGPAN